MIPTLFTESMQIDTSLRYGTTVMISVRYFSHLWTGGGLMEKQMTEEALSRIGRIQGTDIGFFALAVHSFIEGILRERYHLSYGEGSDSFPSLVFRLKDDNPGNWDISRFCHDVVQAHHEVNEVRHLFKECSRDTALVAISHLQFFCTTLGLTPSRALSDIASRMEALWSIRESLGNLFEEKQRLQLQLTNALSENSELSKSLGKLSGIEEETRVMEFQLAQLNVQIEQLEKGKLKQKEKIEQLRKERWELNEQLRAQAQQYEPVHRYVSVMRSMTLYTRTRGDYERMIVRLTAEQKGILERIRLDSDFLVKGGAGTGKTLVLLKGIEKMLGRGEQGELHLADRTETVALVTFTKTLTKFNRYLAHIMKGDVPEDTISTAHSFLLQRIQEADGRWSALPIDQHRSLEEICDRYATESFSGKDIFQEILIFLWGNDITETEYIDLMIERTGMGKPLQKHVRMIVWKAKEEVERLIEQTHRVPFQAFAPFLLRLLDDESVAARISRFDHIFVDEAQDLSAAVLKSLKRLAKRGVILSGDADQSIYQPGFTYVRAGLDIQGKTHILRTNFRNTVQIHALAEHFRSGSASAGPSVTTAFKDGPMPELHVDCRADALRTRLWERACFFTDALGYDPANICIIVPSKTDFGHFSSFAAESDVQVMSIVDEKFSFEEEQRNVMRMTTLHSAKGLDFPVVLLFLTGETKSSEAYDQTVHETLSRNLIYVAMTRAMEHLQVFVLEDPGNKILGDVKTCFRDIRPNEVTRPAID